MRTTKITINNPALKHNLKRVKELSPASKTLAMVKANGYGHGVEMIMPALINNDNVDAIGVACLQEAIEARLLGYDKPIVLIEGVFSQTEWQQAIRYELQCVIHHTEQLNWALNHLPEDNHPTRTIWLKLNTGMNRLGFKPDDILTVAKQLNDSGYSLILTSHFANADIKSHPLNQVQIDTFSHCYNQLKSHINADIQASLCNSAGIVNFPECHYHWIRPGIMIYGSSPVDDKTAIELGLQPVMSFSSKIMAIHQINTGDMVGYGSKWKATKPTDIAIISVGYGDGYPRVVDSTAWVNVHVSGLSYPCAIIGRVAMDMIVIDVSSISHSLQSNNQLDIKESLINADVILWGNVNNDLKLIDGNCPLIDEIATSAGTIGYELLCRMTNRPERQLI